MVEEQIKEDDVRLWDTIIVGGGPAGYTAGLYAARSRVDTLLMESYTVIGQATMTDTIENYPGVDKISGYDLIDGFKKQAQNFGLETAHGTVSNVNLTGSGPGRVFDVEADGISRKTRSLIIATGASPKKLQVKGENEFIGKGVSYCATCDGPFFKGKNVVVVGGGDTAVEEALYLTRFAEKVTIIHRRDRLRSVGVLVERASSSDKIDFLFNTIIEEISGEGMVSGVKLKNTATGEKSIFATSAVFVFVGWKPNTSFLGDIVKFDKGGSIQVDKAMKSSVEGVFACGDCTSKVLHQVATAVGDGATAAFSARKYIEDIKGLAYD